MPILGEKFPALAPQTQAATDSMRQLLEPRETSILPHTHSIGQSESVHSDHLLLSRRGRWRIFDEMGPRILSRLRPGQKRSQPFPKRDQLPWLQYVPALQRLARSTRPPIPTNESATPPATIHRAHKQAPPKPRPPHHEHRRKADSSGSLQDINEVRGKLFLLKALPGGVEYDLTGCGGESLKIEEREEALLQGGHAGEAGGGGSLALARVPWVNDQGFPDAA